MRILHVINNLNVGGAEMVLARLLTADRDEPNLHSVLSLGGDGPVAGLLRRAGVPLYLGRLRPNRPAPMAVAEALRLGRSASPDVVVAWLYHSCLFSELLAATMRRPPAVIWNVRCSIDGVVSNRRLTRYAVAALRLLASRPARIVYNSVTAAQQYQDAGFPATKATVIPNGYDCDRFRPADEQRRLQLRAQFGFRPGAVLIGLIARVHPNKDHQMFFRAATHLLRRHPHVELVLAGRGTESLSASLMHTLSTDELAQRTHCLGEIAHPADLIQVYQLLDISVSSSRTEAFSNTLAESMACGIPCVATDVGDSARILGAAGLVVPAQEPDKLAEALSWLISQGEDARRSLGARARQRILDQFSLAAMVRAFHNVWDEVWSTARCSAVEL